MHIALVHFYSSTPTPVYQEVASALRARGHTVWVGTPNEAGDLAWHDGKRTVGVQRGPARLPDPLLRVPLVASVLRRVVFFGFMLRVRGFLRRARPDIVQVNPTLGACGCFRCSCPAKSASFLIFDRVRRRALI